MSNLTTKHRDIGLYKPFLIGVILGTVAFLPVQSVGWVLPKVLVFSITAVIGIMIIILKRPNILIFQYSNTPTFVKFLISYFAIIILSLAWSIAPVTSFIGSVPRHMGVLTYFMFFVFGLWAMALASSDRGRKILITTFVSCNAIVVLYGLLQVLGWDPFVHVWVLEVFLGRTFSFIGQPNVLGSFILLTLPFIFVASRFAFLELSSTEAPRKEPSGEAPIADVERLPLHSLCGARSRRAVYMLVLLANIVVLLSTASRAALLGLVVCAAVFAFVKRKEIIKSITPKRVITGVLLLTFLIGVGVYSFGQRFDTATEPGRSSSARQIIWGMTWDMIKARPVGYGLETMGIASQQFINPKLYEYERVTAQVDRAHSMPLDLLVTLGPLGLISYYGFLILMLMGLWRRKSEPLCLAGGLALVGYSVSLLFGFETVVTGVWFWIIVGWMVGSLCAAQHDQSRKSAGRTPLLVCLLIAMVISTIISYQWSHSRLIMNNAEQAFYEGKMGDSIQLFLKSNNKFGFDREIILRSVETSIFTLEISDDEDVRDALEKFVRRRLYSLETLSGSMDGMTPLMRAWLNSVTGEELRMESDLEYAIELIPNNITTYRIAMHIYDLVEDEEKSEEMRDALVALLPVYWDAPESTAGVILRKENPWVRALMNNVE